MFADYLKGIAGDELPLEVAFGRHLIAGDLVRGYVTGTDPNHVVTVAVALGDGFGRGWAGPRSVWFAGFARPENKYKFLPGIRSGGNSDPDQGVDSVFTGDTPHSNTAWIRCELPSGAEVGIPDVNIRDNPPTGLSGIYDCQLGDIYDENGDIIDTDVLLTNPADIIIFGLKEIRKLQNSRIDFASLAELRAICDANVMPDWTTLPQGVGLTAKYYDGDAFDTLVSSRIDPVIQFDASSGAPEVGLDPDDFSARYEGKVRAKYSETYTFSLEHDGGAKLYINDMDTPVIDQWSSTGTHTYAIALTAGEFYDIKIEWRDTSGDAALKLSWSSSSQPFQTIPQEKLYPKAENVKRFECHAAFTSGTTFDSFLKSILFSCNGAYQDVNGKLRFFCLDEVGYSYGFNGTNIVRGSFKSYPRFSQQELLSLPNRFIAMGRNLDDRYLQYFDPPVIYDLPELQERSGRVNTEIVNVGNGRRWQILKNLEHYAKVMTAPYIAEFEAMPQSWPVIAGDVVTVTNTHANWAGKTCLVLESVDRAVKPVPDNRLIKAVVWGPDVDPEPPSVPEVVSFVADSESELTLTWGASTDNAAVTGYEVRIKEDGGAYGSWVDAGDVLSYQFTGLDVDTLYIAQVRAYDAVGNRSGASDEASETTDAVTKLLDDIGTGGLVGAYSLRLIRAAYTGAAVRVRRSSDNAEQDIGFDANGDLDWADATTFASGGDLFVTKWYDQSTAGFDLVQTTEANQPELNIGSEQVDFDGSNDYLATATNTGITGDANVTAFWCGSNNGNSDVLFSFGVTGTRRRMQPQRVNSGQANWVFSSDNISFTVTFSGRVLATAHKAAGGLDSTTTLYRNGSAASPLNTPSSNAPDFGNSLLYLGADIAAANSLAGHVTEFILYNAALDSGQLSTAHDDIMTAWGIS